MLTQQLVQLHILVRLVDHCRAQRAPYPQHAPTERLELFLTLARQEDHSLVRRAPFPRLVATEPLDRLRIRVLREDLSLAPRATCRPRARMARPHPPATHALREH
jgi:hypothetical protein